MGFQIAAAMGSAPPEPPFHVMDFKSRRSAVMGRRGMVACSQPLAAEVHVIINKTQIINILLNRIFLHTSKAC